MSLTSIELAQIRADIETLMPDTCSILQETLTSDGQGGWNSSWGTAVAGTAVPCRVDYMTGKEALQAESLKPYQTAVVSMAYDQTVTAANRIVINGVTHTIHSVNTNASWIGVKRAYVERL
jgi:SPP1 family predicted phage head-tail adaptor